MSNRIIEVGGVYKNSYGNMFGRKIFTTVDKVESMKEKFNNIDVYTTVFTYDSEDQNNSTLYGPMYIDLDMDFNDEKEFNDLKLDLLLIVQALEDDFFIPRDRLLIYFTGKKGFHIIVPQTVFGLELRNDTNIHYKKIAMELDKATINKVVDTRIYDRKRLFRLPNTINSKSGLYKVRVLLDDLKNMSFEDMKEYASEPKYIQSKVDFSLVKRAKEKFDSIIDEYYKEEQEKKERRKLRKKVDVKDVKLEPCISNIILEGANEGHRNNTAVILASALFQKGIGEEEIIEIMIDWNDNVVIPSINHMELMATINSAKSMYESDRFYGCTSIKEMGICVDNCLKK